MSILAPWKIYDLGSVSLIQLESISFFFNSSHWRPSCADAFPLGLVSRASFKSLTPLHWRRFDLFGGINHHRWISNRLSCAIWLKRFTRIPPLGPRSCEKSISEELTEMLNCFVCVLFCVFCGLNDDCNKPRDFHLTFWNFLMKATNGSREKSN